MTPIIRLVLMCLLVLSDLAAPTDIWAEDAPLLTQDVAVLFATNRNKTDSEDLDEIYGNDIAPMSYGVCRVRFDPVKLLKEAAEHIPIRFPTERESIVGMDSLSASELSARLDQVAIKQKIIFYIHGYKMSFEKSCRRTALLQRELGPEVRLLLFAWPSQDNLALYTQDETYLRKSLWDISSVMEVMLNSARPASSDVVGHSLGTRGVTAALAELEPASQQLIGELALVAPDMDRLDFERGLPRLSSATGGITIYVSQNDSPLKVSRGVHGEPRLGEAGEHLTLFEGVETIDISEVPQRDIYGHNYHYFNGRVIEDLRKLLVEAKRADARPGLEAAELGNQRYWRMIANEQD